MPITLTELLKNEAEGVYHATEGLFKEVDKDKLGWKPTSGNNWMTTGQLLHHATSACGFCVKGFVTGDWTTPGGGDGTGMEPTADKMPAVKSVDEAMKLLAEDKQTCMKYIVEAGEQNLLTKKSAAPWGGLERTLFQHLSHMILHLSQHKGQLYYYLKLQGQPVHTGHLYGM